MCVVYCVVQATFSFFYTINIFECILTLFLFVLCCSVHYCINTQEGECYCEWEDGLGVFFIFYFIGYHYLVGLIL